MTSKTIKPEFNVNDILGISEFNPKQLQALTMDAMTVLRKEYLYIIPRQFVHDEKLRKPFNGYTKSKKVYVIGCKPFEDTWIPVSVFTMSISALRASYYCTVEEDLKIQAELTKSNLYRAIPGTQVYSVFESGRFIVDTDAKNKRGYVYKDFAFRSLGRHMCLVSQFNQIKNGSATEWDMKVKEEGGITYLDLGRSAMGRYTQYQDELPDLDYRELIGKKKDQYLLDAVQAGLPE